MSMIIIGVLLFALFALTRILLRFRDKKLSAAGLIFWCVLWALLILVAVLPDAASGVTASLGVDRPIDAVAYAGIMLLFYLTFKLYVLHQETQKQLSKIVQELALRKK